MSERTSHIARIHEIADEIGVCFGITSAELGRMVADRLYAEGDEECIVAALADGCANHLRKRLTLQRQATQGARIDQAIATINGERPPKQLSLLEYPITLPGERVIPIRQATGPDIRQARRALEAHRQGLDRTIGQYLHFEAVLAEFPESENVGSLVARGALSVDRLFRQERTA